MKENPDYNRDHERQERVRYLVNIYESGLTDSAIIGYHGTSVEALDFLLDKGMLPGRTIDHKYTGKLSYVAKGDLHFYPKISALPDGARHLIKRQATDEQMTKEAYPYADSNARTHYFLKTFGLDITDKDNVDIAEDITEPDRGQKVIPGPNDEQELAELLQRFNCTEDDLNRVIAEAQQRKGVVLGLDRSLFDDFQVRKGDDFLSEDLFINCPNGLDYPYLKGVRALGLQEKAFFENLRSS